MVIFVTIIVMREARGKRAPGSLTPCPLPLQGRGSSEAGRDGGTVAFNRALVGIPDHAVEDLEGAAGVSVQVRVAAWVEGRGHGGWRGGRAR